MSGKMPTVRDFMTPTPHTIPSEANLLEAQEQMRNFRIRHVPVMKGGFVVGMLSERNATAALISEEGKRFRVEDAMIPTPYIVPPETELDLVVRSMADEKYGSAIVQDEQGNVLGIFTTVDACRALQYLLERVYRS